MYYRITGAEDERNIDNLSWIPFNTDGSPDTSIVPAEDDTTFKEYKYSVSNTHDFTSFPIKNCIERNNIIISTDY